jgi:uracil phosphoribosyltransferase
MPADPGVDVLDHPVIQHRLASLRAISTDSDSFRRLIAEISALVAYEALRDLATMAAEVETPVSAAAHCRRVAESVLLVPILRAGLGMVEAIQEMVPRTEVAHVGLRRDERTLRSEVYLDKLPADLRNRRVAVCDPMLATGGSLARVCSLVKERGASRVQALCVLASEPGITSFRSVHPDVRVTCAALDPDLDGRGYILPGLGDAGDRLFGLPG